eukprot:jgi/Botrbrau1/16178/Bobra.0244s0002.1
MTGLGNGILWRLLRIWIPQGHILWSFGVCAWLSGETQSGHWQCFQDRCPHRLAPLSEGRIEDGGRSLMCSYHGWEFDSSGKCVAIPQVQDPKALGVACSSSRSCVAAYPTKVAQGMLWVWGDASPTAFQDSALTPATVIPELDPENPSLTVKGEPVLEIAKKYMRDVPYSWNMLVENLIDTAHVPYAHHGILGDRYAPGAGDLTFTPSEEGDPYVFGKDTLSMDLKMKARKGDSYFNTKVQFIPPCLVRYMTPNPPFPKAEWNQMPIYITPTAPGKARLLYNVILPANAAPLPLKLLSQLKPMWMDHHRRHLVFDGDGMMLHVAERVLAQEGEEKGLPEAWRRSYYLPAPADRIVTAFRQWLDKNGGPPTSEKEPGPIRWDKPFHLDHWAQHTQNCPHCLKAVKVLQALRVAVAVAAALTAVAAVPLLLPPAQPGQLVPALLLGGLSLLGLAWAKLGAIIQKFYYVDYDHQARN